MWVTPFSLQGKFLRLEPFSYNYIPTFQENYSPELYQYVSNFPKSASFEDMEAYFKKLIEDETRSSCAIIMPDGRIAGRTGYLDIREKHKTLEIGTVIFKEFHSSKVNPESKYLLFKHAFETLGAVRVQIKTDARNLQSQRAIEKLGAVKEGVLRNYQIRSDGYMRDTVMYSVIDKEWAGVKERLEARLYVA
jgi:N-acetyltransferase